MFDGAITAAGTDFEATESGLFVGDAATVSARTDATLVAFVIDSDAPITRRGTVGR